MDRKRKNNENDDSSTEEQHIRKIAPRLFQNNRPPLIQYSTAFKLTGSPSDGYICDWVANCDAGFDGKLKTEQAADKSGESKEEFAEVKALLNNNNNGSPFLNKLSTSERNPVFK